MVIEKEYYGLLSERQQVRSNDNNFWRVRKVIMHPAQHKKLYENALSSGQSPQSLKQALNTVLRLAIVDHSHFNFLLHNINWFNQPYLAHIALLEKALRVYRGRGKESEKVAYNILADGMWSPMPASEQACQCLMNLIKPGFDHKLLKESLRENYPHKVTELEHHKNYLQSLLYLYHRVDGLKLDILEIVLVELACFDTELYTCTGEPEPGITFPPDPDPRPTSRAKAISITQEHIKFDHLISYFLEELSNGASKNAKLFEQLLLVFKNDLLLVQQTKYVQFVVYFFAERGKKEGKDFVTFLLCEIIENKANRKVLASVAHYLASYLCRSTVVTGSFISKTVANLIKIINQALDSKTISTKQNGNKQEKFQNLNLSNIYEQNFDILILLQAVLWIWAIRPECRDQNTQQLQSLLKKCQNQIYYKYFINHRLLCQIPIITIQQGTNLYKCLEIVSKFNPPQMKRLSHYVDSLIRPYNSRQESTLKLEMIKSQVKYENIVQGMPTKRVKSEKKQSQETHI